MGDKLGRPRYKRLMTANVFQEALSSTSNLLNMVTASRCRNEVCCAEDDHLEKWI